MKPPKRRKSAWHVGYQEDPDETQRCALAIAEALDRTQPGLPIKKGRCGTMTHYLDNHNARPKPFVWTKSAAQILEKLARAKQALESVH